MVKQKVKYTCNDIPYNLPKICLRSGFIGNKKKINPVFIMYIFIGNKKKWLRMSLDLLH